MKLKVLFGLVLSIFSLTIVGCGGGGEETPTPVTTVSGEASKGPIIGADVKIFAINADGSVQTTPLATTPAKVTTRAPFGNYSAVIGYAGPVKVVVTGTIGSKYKDEATGTDVDFNGKTLSAVASNVAGSVKVAVTPYTELAVQTAKKAGTALTPANIEKANVAVADALNLHGVDIVTASPSTNPVYKFALGVISETAGITATGLSDKLATIAGGIDVATGTIKDSAVSSLIAAKTGEAYQNTNIRPANTTIPGVDATAIAGVNITVPTGDQQNITALAPNATVAISVAVTRVDGKPSPNTIVSFAVTTGTGAFTAASATTDANGVAKINLSSSAEGAVGFSATAGKLTSSSSVVFNDLNKPGTVELTSDSLSGVTQGHSPVTFTATVNRLAGGPVPDGTPVTFAIVTDTTGTPGATLSALTVNTIGGKATTKLNSTNVGNITVKAMAGTGNGIKTSGSITVNFIFQPVTATLKLTTLGTLPAGITNITSVIGTLTIVPAGVTIKTVVNPNSATGISADPLILNISGVASSNASLLPAEVTPATATVGTQILVPLVSVTGGFATGEFATVVTDVAVGTFPKASDFVLSGFKVIAKDATGAQVTIPTSNMTVGFILTLQ